MKAMAFSKFGGPETLAPMEAPTPEPGPGELLVRVLAAGVNPIDTKVRRGEVPLSRRPEQGPVIPGYDGAGLVQGLGKGVSGFAFDDAVYFAGDVRRQGSYAEFVTVDARLAAAKPQSLSFEEAAVVPLTAITVWETFFENMSLLPADENPANAEKTLLVVGGAGGVGSLAIQVAKQVLGLRVLATAGSLQSQARCLASGADEVLDHNKPLIPQLGAINGSGADYLLNCGGNERVTELMDLLNPRGHLCLLVGSPHLKSVDLTALRMKSAALSFEFMFTAPVLDHHPERHGRYLTETAALLDRGVIRGGLKDILPLEEAAAAHRLVEGGQHRGKIALAVDRGQ